MHAGIESVINASHTVYSKGTGVPFLRHAYILLNLNEFILQTVFFGILCCIICLLKKSTRFETKPV